MIELDGSMGEGGGQILRTALALSLITQKPFTLSNIRAKRPKPGLLRQHLTCVRAAAAVSGYTDTAIQDAIEGCYLGSKYLVFKPAGLSRPNQYGFEVGSAGSTMLVLQTILWPLLLANEASEIVLTGGTHNPFAPSATYLQHTLSKVLSQIGGKMVLNVEQYGFYPVGGGRVRVQLTPTPQFRLFQGKQRGALLRHSAQCLLLNIPYHVSERELQKLLRLLNWSSTDGSTLNLKPAIGQGNDLIVILEFEHVTEVFNVLGEKTLRSEIVATKLAHKVKKYLQTPAYAGEHLADQLMLPAAIGVAQALQSGDKDAQSHYTVQSLTPHSITNAKVIELFLPVKFHLKPETRHTVGEVMVTGTGVGVV